MLENIFMIGVQRVWKTVFTQRVYRGGHWDNSKQCRPTWDTLYWFNAVCENTPIGFDTHNLSYMQYLTCVGGLRDIVETIYPFGFAFVSIFTRSHYFSTFFNMYYCAVSENWWRLRKKSIFMLNDCLIKVIGESSLGFCFNLFTICPIYTELKATKAPAYESQSEQLRLKWMKFKYSS